jgi:hypothetical protein
MPNTPVRAAAEGMPSINRRKALAITGSGLVAALAGLAASVQKAPAAALVVEQPWEKAKGLAHDLSDALNHLDDGVWDALVKPSMSTASPVWFRQDMSKRPPDADLLALGRELDRELAFYDGLRQECHRLYALCLPLFVIGGYRDEQDAFFAASKASGHDKACRVADRSFRRLDKLAKRIDAVPAVTVAGFAVKATALLWDIFLCESDDETDRNTIAYRRFVAAMRRSGGVS